VEVTVFLVDASNFRWMSQSTAACAELFDTREFFNSHGMFQQ
jgi:hypothetical protein